MIVARFGSGPIVRVCRNMEGAAIIDAVRKAVTDGAGRIVTRGVVAELVVHTLCEMRRRRIVENLSFDVGGVTIRIDEEGHFTNRWPGGFFIERRKLLEGEFPGEY